jgi:hypothetical protein
MHTISHIPAPPPPAPQTPPDPVPAPIAPPPPVEDPPPPADPRVPVYTPPGSTLGLPNRITQGAWSWKAKAGNTAGGPVVRTAGSSMVAATTRRR